jgi:two-component system OmpR family sensor kinase/two-component system sensor histidine kinase BaeS
MTQPATPMKPRLFWTMLLAFVLVIVLGVCGMLGLFVLAFSGIWQPRTVRDSLQESQQAWVASLGDYYVAHGNSWVGVDQRLSELPWSGEALFFNYTLLDENGRVVASNNRAVPTGQPVPPGQPLRGLPVEVSGAPVGTLLLRSAPAFAPDAPAPTRGPPSIIWRIASAFLAAGAGLSIGLLVLAVIFAQGLSRPLRRITVAAQSLASGQLDVQVRGAAVRELDDLASAFNAMARSLAQADRQRRQMTADIAHELRTPLTIIKGRLEGLQDGVYSATPDQIEQLLVEATLLERLIEDLRLLALAETGQLPLHPELLDPRELLVDAATAFAAQSAAQGVTLHVEAPDDLPAINADPLRMAQVLSNLVANALHHTPAGGSITLAAARSIAEGHSPITAFERGAETRRRGDAETRRRGEHAETSLLVSHALADPRSSFVVLKVSDTGQGIAPADLPHIFERFWRADRSRTRASGGAGLGLAIARQIVVAHGGAIWAASTPEQGTTISVALPVGEEG